MRGAANSEWEAEQNGGRAAYLRHLLPHVPRLLGQLDREPDSASYGSFDREHWGWKFRDFPITMLQTAVQPLAMLWRSPLPGNPYFDNPQVLAWIVAAVEETRRRQRANGSYDSVGPFTQDHGVTLAMAYTLAETALTVGEDLPAGLSSAVAETVDRCCRFALRSSEDYAFISNHQALFALAYHSAHRLTGGAEYLRRAEAVVLEIIRRQSPDGWYLEYDGADPGYESLGIHYLANYWQRTGDARLLDSLRRSVAFFSHFVHPDGSVGGVYGSRHTSLYYPGGFEILSAELPAAASVARFMRQRLSRNNVVTPSVSDAENLASLTSSYLTASLAPENETDELPPLPCESLDGIRQFDDSSITVAGARRYYAIVNASKGGVCRIFDKQAESVAYEDAGYLVRAGGRLWTSQLIGLGRRADGARPNEVVCETVLAESRQELPTPGKFLLLRALNLTLFRSLRLGAWLRRLILQRLILAKRRGPFALCRAVAFGEDEIRFRDSLKAETSAQIEEVSLPRSYTAIHMGSARYFHAASLEPTPIVPVGAMAKDLTARGEAHCEFTVRFRAGGPSELIINPVQERTESAPVESFVTTQ